MSPIEFNAPWSRALKVTSTVATVFLLCVMTIGISIEALAVPARLLMVGVPAIIFAATSAFIVRGYSLTDRELKIKRLLWTNTLSLEDLRSVEGKADALKGALRIAGNAGMLALTGLYWSRQLGLFRVYGTDPSRAVVLRFSRRTLVITPHDPQHFIMRARTFINIADFPR